MVEMVKERVFIKITNGEIYKEIKETKEIVQLIADQNKFHRKWLWTLTGSLCTGFLFLIGLIINSK